MDAFFASVEQRDFPELRGKPVCVGGNKERGVVAAASYEARKYGVFSAMSSKIAYQKCPEIIFVKPRFEVYKEVSVKIRAIFRRYTDKIEPLSLDEAYLDVTENKMGIETATEIAQLIKDSIKEELNLIASAGVSVNKFLAKVASDQDKPDGLYVITPNKIERFIALLPIKKFHGIGKVTEKKLNNLGVYFGKDLQRLSIEELEDNFKSRAQYFYNICRGIDHREVKAHRERKSVGCERTFDINVISKEGIKEELEKLLPKLYERKLKADFHSRTLTLKIKFFDFKQITRSKTELFSLNTIDEIKGVMYSIWNALPDDLPEIRLLGLSLSNIDKQDEKQSQLTLDL
jgi:DNA polymerase-4